MGSQPERMIGFANHARYALITLSYLNESPAIPAVYARFEDECGLERVDTEAARSRRHG